MSQPPTLEYSSELLGGSVSVRASTDRLIVTLYPSKWRIVSALIGPVLLACFAVALYWTFSNASTSATYSPWGIAVFPVVFLALSIAGGIGNAIIKMNPIHFEVDAANLSARWRTLVRANAESWLRQSILDLTVERILIKGQMLKRWSLVVRHRERGKIVVLRARKNELELMASRLRAALGLPEMQSPAMLIPPPPNCTFVRTTWMEGAAIYIPPKFQRTSYAITIAVAVICTGSVCWWLNLTSDAGAHQEIAGAILAVILSAFGSLLIIQGLKKLRKATGIGCSPQTLLVEETGLFSPLNVRWPWSEVESIRVVNGDAKRGHLEIVVRDQPPLIVAARRKICDLEWAMEVVKKASEGRGAETAAAPKTESTANTTPAPARTPPPSADPSPQ